MTGDVRAFLKVSYPMLLGLVLLVLNLRVEAIARAEPKLSIPLPVGGVEVTLSTAWLVSLLLNGAALFCLLVPAFRNYSGFFPKRLKMDVYFDDAGIEELLAGLTTRERNELNIAAGWRQSKAQYLEMLNDKLRERFPDSQFQFTGRSGVLHSAGETFFDIEKVRGCWQTYHIEACHGYLEHCFQVPEGSEQRLRTEFELLETGSSYVRTSLRDIYTRFAKVLKPEFKQEIRLSATELLYSGSVVGVTKVRFFPVPEVGGTVYFVSRETDGALVPVAYAKYRGE